MMLEYLEDDTVTCGRVLRHEASGSDKASRIWVYRNDLGEEYLSNGKWECQRQAKKDLRMFRVDLVVEYTASGSIHRFDFSDVFQQKNINDVAEKLKTARIREEYNKKLYKQAREENKKLQAKLKTIEEFIRKCDQAEEE
tara:strand:- start:1111 stop:1530 length:420 start_codon:yes stop_codon:yes gene_type:complete